MRKNPVLHAKDFFFFFLHIIVALLETIMLKEFCGREVDNHICLKPETLMKPPMSYNFVISFFYFIYLNEFLYWSYFLTTTFWQFF